MNCQEFRERVEHLIDDRAATDTLEIQTHAGVCAACAGLLAEVRLLDQAVAVWKPLSRSAPPANLPDRVLAALYSSGHTLDHQVDADDQKPVDVLSPSGTSTAGGSVRPATTIRPAGADSIQASARRRVWPLLASLALVMLAVLAVFREQPRQVAQDDAAPAPVVVAVASQDRETADLQHLISDARSAWSDLTRRAANRASGLSVFVPDLASELGFDPADPPAGTNPMRSEGPESAPRSVPQFLPGDVERAFDLLFAPETANAPQTT